MKDQIIPAILTLVVGIAALYTAWRHGYEEGKQEASKTISNGEGGEDGASYPANPKIYTCIHGVPLSKTCALCLRVKDDSDTWAD